MRKVLFIDRDGTIIIEPQPSQQIDSYDKLEFLPYAITSLAKICSIGSFELVMVTNQDGLGTESFSEAHFWPAQNLMLKVLANEGIAFSEILIDKSKPEENAQTRKPKLGMLQHYVNATDIDWDNSWVIGDRMTDVALAQNLGCKNIAWLGSLEDLEYRFANIDTLLLKSNINPNQPPLEKQNVRLYTEWLTLADDVVLPARKLNWERNTNETKIRIELNLDGSGHCEIETGLGFFDHMLEQIGKHGGLDLKIKTKGDLHIDQHHTIEDTAIALGEAIKTALGNKKGIKRYGFVLPMDDCQAKVAIDFGGRPWLVWDATFKREYVGDVPTEMFFHFFKSFSDGAAANLQIEASGENEHHKIEAIFKGLAKCIRQAAQRDYDRLHILPSTKGLL